MEGCGSSNGGTRCEVPSQSLIVLVEAFKRLGDRQIRLPVPQGTRRGVISNAETIVLVSRSLYAGKKIF